MHLPKAGPQHRTRLSAYTRKLVTVTRIQCSPRYIRLARAPSRARVRQLIHLSFLSGSSYNRTTKISRRTESNRRRDSKPFLSSALSRLACIRRDHYSSADIRRILNREILLWQQRAHIKMIKSPRRNFDSTLNLRAPLSLQALVGKIAQCNKHGLILDQLGKRPLKSETFCGIIIKK